MKSNTGSSIYLSAAFTRRFKLRSLRDALDAHSIRCLCSWIDHEADETGSESPEERAGWCAKDLAEIRECGTFIAITEPAFQELLPWPTDGNRGGRHVEFGYALAMGKRCIVYGQPEHHFHCLPDVTVIAEINELVLALRVEP